MLGSLFVLIAGWYRSKLAAAVIVVISFGLQVALVIPGVSENRRLLGLPEANLTAMIFYNAAELVIAGLILYFIGSGVRWLWERRKRPKNL